MVVCSVSKTQLMLTLMVLMCVSIMVSSENQNVAIMQKVGIIRNGIMHCLLSAPPFLVCYGNDATEDGNVFVRCINNPIRSSDISYNRIVDYCTDGTFLYVVGKETTIPPTNSPITIYGMEIRVGMESEISSLTMADGGKLLTIVPSQSVLLRPETRRRFIVSMNPTDVISDHYSIFSPSDRMGVALVVTRVDPKGRNKRELICLKESRQRTGKDDSPTSGRIQIIDSVDQVRPVIRVDNSMHTISGGGSPWLFAFDDHQLYGTWDFSNADYNIQSVNGPIEYILDEDLKRLVVLSNAGITKTSKDDVSQSDKSVTAADDLIKNRYKKIHSNMCKVIEETQKQLEYRKNCKN